MIIILIVIPLAHAQQVVILGHEVCMFIHHDVLKEIDLLQNMTLGYDTQECATMISTAFPIISNHSANDIQSTSNGSAPK